MVGTLVKHLVIDVDFFEVDSTDVRRDTPLAVFDAGPIEIR